MGVSLQSWATEKNTTYYTATSGVETAWKQTGVTTVFPYTWTYASTTTVLPGTRTYVETVYITTTITRTIPCSVYACQRPVQTRFG